MGRGKGVKFRTVPQQPVNKFGAVLAHREAASWSALGQRLVEYRRYLVGVGSTCKKEVNDLSQWIRSKASKAANAEWGFEFEIAQELQAFSEDVYSLSREQLRDLTQKVKEVAKKRFRQLKGDRDQEFTKWINEKLLNGAKLLHEWAK